MDLSFDSEHRLRAENLCWDIDVWYPILKDQTFKTIFIPLTVFERNAIIEFHNVSWRNISPKLSNYHTNILNQLEQNIQLIIQENHSDGYFIRLCGRSPKDGEPNNRENVWRKYESNLNQLLQNGDVLNIHTKMTAIARTPWMQIFSGADVMSLILTSERVYSDMIDWKRFGEPEQICLREFNQELSIDYEFRIFVYNHKITAITQYDHYSYYKHLFPLKDEIHKQIQDLWFIIHQLIRVSTYIIDMAYLPSTGKMIMVELSPFFPCTGPAEFNWKNDIGILKGEEPFEFRLKAIDTVHPQLDELMELNWDMRWKKLVPSYRSFYYNEGNDDKKMDTLKWSIWNLIYPPSPSPVPPPTDTKQDLSDKETTTLLFVYGTLKRGYYWNTKYLSHRVGGRYVCEAITTEPHYLTLGDCGVPYLLLLLKNENTDTATDTADTTVVTGKRIKGELWEVTADCLRCLDDYEGVSKGYYNRATISVTIDDEATRRVYQSSHIQAAVYILAKERHTSHLFSSSSSSSDSSFSSSPSSSSSFLAEYTLDMQRAYYNPISHIQIKQVKYFQSPSTWGSKLDQATDMSATLLKHMLVN